MNRQNLAPLQERWTAFSALPLSVRRRFALLVAPWFVILFVGLPWLWVELDTASQAPLVRAQEGALLESQEILQRTFNSLRQDIALLADLTTPVLSDTPAASRLLLTFAKSAIAYDQVRWLDEHGDEKLRVNTRAGSVLVPQAELQNKKDRPYFSQAVRLPSGHVYLSELDLNVERGVVERPFEPMLRIASPVQEAGRSRGVVVINYRATRLLDRLSTLGKRQGLGIYLVNDAGYWLQAPREEESWAWQLNAPQFALARTYPALWTTMQQTERGHLHDASGQWAFLRFRPSATPIGDANDRRNIVSELGLRVVVRIQPDLASQANGRWKWVLLAVSATAFVLALRYSWTTMQAFIEEDAQSRALRTANLALTQANDNLRSMQAELARAERLSSLGLMVAGVAHELNTPLGSAGLSLSTVQQSVKTLQEQLSAGLRKSDLDRFLSQSQAALDLVDASIRRAAGIVQRFKQVAVDRTTMERRKFDLAEAIIDADPRLRKWDTRNPIALNLDLQRGVQMDSYPGPLEQVISNLLANALTHAFVGRTHGHIAIQSTTDGPDHVQIRISDDGLGIPRENWRRVFDPFFTTNRHSGGTGLGLHISHQLVTEMLGGTITVTNLASQVGTGTTFVIRLPRVAPPSAPTSD